MAAALPDLIIGLGLLVGFLAAYGLLYGYTYSLGALLRGVAWFLGNLKINVWFVSVNVGDWLAKELKKLDHGIQNVLGTWVQTMDSAMGKFLHANAVLAQRIASFFEGVGNDVASGFEWTKRIAIPHAINDLGKLTRAKFKGIDETFKDVKNRLAWLARHLGIDAARATRIADNRIATKVGHIPGRVGTLERWEREAKGEITGLRTKFGTKTFAGLVAASLAALGLRGLLCRRMGNLGEKVCATHSGWWQDVLGLLTDFLVLANICQVIPLLNDGFELVAAPMIEEFGKVGAGLCNSSYKPAKRLAPPALYLPAASLTLSLPE